MELRTFQWIVFCFSSALSIGYAKFIIKKMEMCDNSKNYLFKWYANLHMVNDKQFVSTNATMEIPLDDSIRGNITVEMIRGKNDGINLIRRHANNACTTMHKNFGEFMSSVEQQCQLTPGRCPIPKGKYELHDYPLNFDSVPARVVPYGNLRFTTYLIKGGNVVTCGVAEVENRA